MNKEMQRIAWIDIAKGMAIFLMVCGHTSIPLSVSNWIWSFHMPLFFVVSGMLFSPDRYPSAMAFVRKRCMSLLVPWISFTIITVLCSPSDSIRLLCEGRNLHALWFLPVLFVVEIMGYYLSKIAVEGGKLLFALVMASVGFVMEKYGIRLPFNLEASLYATLFYTIGFVCKRIITTSEPKWMYILFLLAVNVSLSQVLPRTDIAANKIGMYGVNALNAFVGTMAIFFLAQKEESWNRENLLKKFFVWAGQNTLIILGLSAVINLPLKSAMEHFLLPPIVNTALRHTLLWYLLWLISRFVNRYIPEIIGKKRK